ncbi:hypothetical protein L1887_35456 [Cichorium endivia]|nr:hypothetical protein L1887_35456 [Cichorium endivia]
MNDPVANTGKRTFSCASRHAELHIFLYSQKGIDSVKDWISKWKFTEKNLWLETEDQQDTTDLKFIAQFIKGNLSANFCVFIVTYRVNCQFLVIEIRGGQIQIAVPVSASAEFDRRRSESRSVGFEPTTSGFGDPRSTELN